MKKNWLNIGIFIGLISILSYVLLTFYPSLMYPVKAIDNKTLILGHGGLGIGRWYPINSWASLKGCLDAGAAGTEIDVQMTADSVLLAFHDDKLSKKTKCKGKVYQQEWQDLSQCAYKWHPSQKVLKLEHILAAMPSKNAVIFSLDCKLPKPLPHPNFVDTYARQLHALLQKKSAAKQVLIEAQNTDLLVALQALNPNYLLFIYPPNFEKGFALAQQFNLQGISIDWRKVNQQQVAQAQAEGYKVMLWNMHGRSKNRQALQLQPDYIQTDYVHYVVSLLEE